jgi:hypothetical protein
MKLNIQNGICERIKEWGAIINFAVKGNYGNVCMSCIV